MKLSAIGRVLGFGILLVVLLFFGLQLWIISGTSVSLIVHLTGDATIDPVRVSLCGRPVSLSGVNKTTYRYEARWIFWCPWAELGVDLVSPSGKVLHHQLCYYEGIGAMDSEADIAPDNLTLKCKYRL